VRSVNAARLTVTAAVVIGGGIAGVSCARRFVEHGVAVQLIDRGQKLGGRMATREVRGSGTQWDGHIIDIGASYFTVADPGFRTVVDDWLIRDLAREWTDAFHVASSDGITGVRAGPMRYAATTGLRSLVIDLAGDDIPVEVATNVERIARVPHGFQVDERRADCVALCMPVPQAQHLWPLPAEHVWEPVIAVTAVYRERCWPEIDGVFVNDDPVLTWIADDGRRRGDGAAVLVAHVNPVLAARHLTDVTGVLPNALATVQRILQTTDDPVIVDAHRWTYARPLAPHGASYWRDAEYPIGIAGDAWSDAPRIEAAWLSGRALADALQ
jgi:renalase